MKMRICILISIFFLSGCLSLKNNKPSLAKRYHTINATVDKSGNDAVIEVTPEVLPSTPTTITNKTVYDLTTEGQKAYIKVIGEKSKDDLDKFTEEMNKKYLTEESESNILDISSRKLHIVFSISQKDFYNRVLQDFALGDRIEYLKMTVKLNPSIYKFSNWDKFNTQYGVYNIGSRSFTNSKEVNINPSIPFITGAATLGFFDNKSQFTENDSLKRRFILLNGILQDSQFTLEESGTSEINLTGNPSVDVTLDLISSNFGKDVTENFIFKNLKTKNGFSDAKDVSVSINKIVYPQLPGDITATFNCTYAIRHILNGDNTFAENDDNIEYFHGTIPSSVITLVKKNEAKPTQWGIKIGELQLLMYNTFSDKAQELSFSSFSEADDFFTWLLHIRPSIDNILTIDNYQLLMRDITHNTVYFNNKIAPETIKIVVLP